MTTYKDQLQLAAKAAETLGPESGATLMDMLVASERVETQVMKMRAEFDGKFVELNGRFVEVDRKLLDTENRLTSKFEGEMTSLRRFMLTTAMTATGIVLASVIGLAALIVTRH